MDFKGVASVMGEDACVIGKLVRVVLPSNLTLAVAGDYCA